MAKKAKAIETLSLQKCRKHQHAMLDFIRQKTASGSIPSSSTVFWAVFGCQQPARLSFVFVQPMIDLDCTLSPLAF